MSSSEDVNAPTRELEFYVELHRTVVRRCRVVAATEKEAIDRALNNKADLFDDEATPFKKTHAWPVDRSVYKILPAEGGEP